MEVSSFWQEMFDLFLFVVYLLFALGASFLIIYFVAVEIIGFDLGKAEMFTIIGLTVSIFLVLVIINFFKLKNWWQGL